ncbi:hypothetical protein PPERSA_05233 [Pseudocohnilembus persalinus]|uniref:CRC domain-containing protein n=1 Tax=Pseudocohnilembus persalinus TaxID=266149 RepID=A0A0V0QYB2_PSEPJ|nr:hypothetical protein PPERSA_05233 [Pseudocohnilembus persalinus]|eukprot:KRX07069.1 hypothetical protein PPERSA_05233 [Pseudocohnilembus persalinus]
MQQSGLQNNEENNKNQDFDSFGNNNININNLKYMRNSNNNLGFGENENCVNYSGNFNNIENNIQGFENQEKNLGYNDNTYFKSGQDFENNQQSFDAEFLHSNGTQTYQISGEQSFSTQHKKSTNNNNLNSINMSQNQNCLGSTSNPNIEFSSFNYSSANQVNLKKIQEQSGDLEQDQGQEYDNLGGNFYDQNIEANININNERLILSQGQDLGHNLNMPNFRNQNQSNQGQNNFFLQFDSKQGSQVQIQNENEINGSFLLASSNKNSNVRENKQQLQYNNLSAYSGIASQVGSNIQYSNNGGVQFGNNNNYISNYNNINFNNNNNNNNSFTMQAGNSYFSYTAGRDSKQKKGSNLQMSNNQFQDVLSKMSAMSIENNKSIDNNMQNLQQNRLGMSFENGNLKIGDSKISLNGLSKFSNQQFQEQINKSFETFLKSNSVQSSNRSQYQKKIGFLFKVEEEEKLSKENLSNSETSQKFQKYLQKEKIKQFQQYQQDQYGSNIQQQSKDPSQFSSQASKNLSQQISFAGFRFSSNEKNSIRISQETKGCSCNKSHCLKQYCICFQKKQLCNPQFCKCQSCKNVEGNEERNSEIEKKLKQNPRAFDDKFQEVDIREILGKQNSEKLFQYRSKNNKDLFKLATPEMYQQFMQKYQEEENQKKLNKSQKTEKEKTRVFEESQQLKIENQESSISQLMVPGKEIFLQRNYDSQSQTGQESQQQMNSNFYSRYEESQSQMSKQQAQQMVQNSKKTVVYKQGCTCKKSHCIKKYCECFNKQIKCTKNCSCRDCHNQEELVPDEEEIKQLEELKKQEMELHEINQKRQLDLQQRQMELPRKKRQLIGADLDEDY